MARGEVYEKKGDLDKALANYTESIGLDPKDGLARFRRGLVYGKKGERAKAEEDFAQAKRLGYKPE